MLRFALLVVIVVLSTSASAEVPQVVSYQGRLTDDNGAPIDDGKYRVQFRIWTTPEGPGFVLWDSGPQVIDVQDGLFTYFLGSAAPLPLNLFSDDTARWLGMTLEDNPETVPRYKITSAAYSYHSLTTDTAEFARAAPTPFIAETKTVSGITGAVGPDQGTITFTFDSSFTHSPLLMVTVVLTAPSGSLSKGSVLYAVLDISSDEFTATVFEKLGGPIMSNAAIDVTYMALQIGQ